MSKSMNSVFSGVLCAAVVSTGFVSAPIFSAQSSQTIHNFSSGDGTVLFGKFYHTPNPKGLLVVVHGLQSHTDWYQNGDVLAAAGFSTFMFDRRGSGRSSGKRGHIDKPEQLLEDLDAALKFARTLAPNIPLHLLANSMGLYSAFEYAKKNPSAINSLIFTVPSAAVLSSADYTLLQKVKIYLSAKNTYYKSPLVDTDFVSSGPGLEWIQNDTLGQRKFTASFLRSVNTLRGRALDLKGVNLSIPMLFVLATRDRIVDNAKAKTDFFDAYTGPKELVEIDTDHFIGFTPQAEVLNQHLIDWLKIH